MVFVSLNRDLKIVLKMKLESRQMPGIKQEAGVSRTFRCKRKNSNGQEIKVQAGLRMLEVEVDLLNDEMDALSVVMMVIWHVSVRRQVIAATTEAVSNVMKKVTWRVNVQTLRTKTEVVDVVVVVPELVISATRKVIWQETVQRLVEMTITEMVVNLTSDLDVMTVTAISLVVETTHGEMQVTSKRMAGATATLKATASGERC